MKRCSILYIIREIQMKTVRFHYSTTRKAKIQNTDNTKYWRMYGPTGALRLCWQEATLQDRLVVSYKTKHPLTL